MPSDENGQCTDGTEHRPHQDEQYEECDICGGSVDVFNANYYNSHDDETFRHLLCHENGESTEGYVFELAETDKCCLNRQYNCGHLVYAPVSEQPQFCPECNDLEYDDGEWSVQTDTEQMD